LKVAGITLKTWHQIHKWISIAVGLFLLVWLVSGVVMVLPERWFQPLLLAPGEGIDYTSASLSPQAAIEHLEQTKGEEVQVSWVGFSALDGRLAYHLYLVDGSSALIDATTGEPIVVDVEMAERIASRLGDGGTGPGTVQWVYKHDLVYPFGPLPVYRVIYDRSSAPMVYVSPEDGSVSVSSPGTRLRSALASLHTFEPLRLLTPSERLRKGLLVLLGLVGIGTALTGYFLAILPLLRRKTHLLMVASREDQR
jgi:hypothetical protein